MADIATLSFAIDSKPLARANTELSKMPAAAGGAEKAVDNLNKTTKELEKTTVAATAATRNLGQYARTGASGWGATAAAAAAAANANIGLVKATGAVGAASASTARLMSASTVAVAAGAAATRAAANDNQKLVLSAVAVAVAYKLAAAVISGLFAGAVSSTMKVFVKETDSINGAFKTLGETWSETFDIGKQAATPLRHAIEDLTIAIENPAFTGFIQLIGRIMFAALALAVKGVTALVEGFSWLIDNIRALSIAFAPALAALNLMDTAFEKVFGIGLYEIIKKSVNFLIGSFVAAYGDIKFLWENFPDIISAAFVGAVNAAIRGINAMVSFATKGINELIALANKVPGVSIAPLDPSGPLKEVDNPAAGRLAGATANRGAQQQQELSRDYLGEAGNYLTNNLGRRRITDTPPDKTKPGAAGAADPYAKAIEYGREYIEMKKAETAAVGQTVEAASRLKHEQELLNKAQTDGKTVSAAQAAAIKGLAADMAAADSALATAKFQNDNKTKTAEFLAAQQLERDALFMSKEAAAAARFEQEMLNDAKQKGVDLTPGVVESIKQEAAARAESQEKTRRYSEQVQLAKDVTSGFMSDINQGIRDGANVWEIFGNAAENALTKISDKLMQMAMDQLFENAFPKGGGAGGGGIWGTIIDIVGGAVGGAAGGGAAGSGSVWANGGAFRAGNVIPFATGGIVGSPSMFPMAGGRTGLMGEAGPEAIMPLKRGPGGRLGVEAANSNRQQPVVVNVYANEGFVRAEAEGAAVRVVNGATPGIVGKAVKQSGQQTPAVMERNERERGGDWRA